MGTRHVDTPSKGTFRQTFNIPNVSGAYANEVIDIAGTAVGQAALLLRGVTALIEVVGGQGPLLARVELWLPRAPDGGEVGVARVTGDFFYSGQVLAQAGVALTVTGEAVSFGSATWTLSKWPGARIRVKSGGYAGVVTVSASAW